MKRGFFLAAAEKKEKKKESEKKSEQRHDLKDVHVESPVGYRVVKEPGIKILKFDSDVDVNLTNVDDMLKVFAKASK